MEHTKERLSNTDLQKLLAGCDGVQDGPWFTMTETRQGDRSQYEEIEIWSKANDVLVTTEVRRAHGDGGRRTMSHIARCDPDTIRALVAEVLATRPTEEQ